jgi:hypothetical protein
MISSQRISPQARVLLQFIPLPNVNTGSFNSNLQEQDPLVINKDQYTERIDFVENAKSNWYGRFSWGSELQSQASVGGTGNNVSTQPNQQMISNTRIFKPTLVNEFRATHIGFANSHGDIIVGKHRNTLPRLKRVPR